MNSATLRSKLETALAGKVLSPFTYRDRKTVKAVTVGIPAVDSLAGGLPCGSLVEICGPPCSGLTTLMFSALAMRTAQSQLCALIDGRDAFYPHFAEAAGVELGNLLWVRCHTMDQCLRATDLILQGGGFGMVVLDLSDIPAEIVRHVPLNTWFRFRRTVEDTTTILLLLERESNAKTCASLVLRFGEGSIQWKAPGEAVHREPHPLVYLLDGFRARVELLHCRIQPMAEIPTHQSARLHMINTAKQLPASSETGFEIKTTWGYSGSSLE